MEFHVKETPFNHEKELIGEVRDINGDILIDSVIIPGSYAHSSINYLKMAKEKLTQTLEKKLGERAIERSRQMVECDNYRPRIVQNQWANEYLNQPLQYWTDSTSSGTTVAYETSLTATTSGTFTTCVTSTWDDCEVKYSDYGRLLETEVEVPFGKRTITVTKKHKPGEKIKITDEDIREAFKKEIENTKCNILIKRSERKAENLLKSMVSEIDFRDYKEKGYFLVRSGKRLFKIYQDKRKWVDMWEFDENKKVYEPKNRLCTHTNGHRLPDADEALAKLLLIRSNSIVNHSNLHPIDQSEACYVGQNMNRLKEKELVLN